MIGENHFSPLTKLYVSIYISYIGVHESCTFLVLNYLQMHNIEYLVRKGVLIFVWWLCLILLAGFLQEAMRMLTLLSRFRYFYLGHFSSGIREIWLLNLEDSVLESLILKLKGEIDYWFFILCYGVYKSREEYDFFILCYGVSVRWTRSKEVCFAFS